MVGERRTLLGEYDLAPADVHNGDGKAPIVVICDHASANIPKCLNKLELSPADLGKHIAVDIGALDASKRLADLCDAPLIFCNYSRLVIDCNRYVSDPESVVSVSDGVEVPVNSAMSSAERRLRIEEIFTPYHAVIVERIEEYLASGVAPALLFVHSCTPQLRGGALRNWDIGISWALDERISRPVIENLQAAGSFEVGDNQPYRIDLAEDYSACEHALRRGLPHLQVELRQDLIASARDAHEWASILFDALQPVLSNADLYAVKRFWPRGEEGAKLK